MCEEAVFHWDKLIGYNAKAQLRRCSERNQGHAPDKNFDGRCRGDDNASNDSQDLTRNEEPATTE
jgi:hypothetical protein